MYVRGVFGRSEYCKWHVMFSHARDVKSFDTGSRYQRPIVPGKTLEIVFSEILPSLLMRKACGSSPAWDFHWNLLAQWDRLIILSFQLLESILSFGIVNVILPNSFPHHYDVRCLARGLFNTSFVGWSKSFYFRRFWPSEATSTKTIWRGLLLYLINYKIYIIIMECEALFAEGQRDSSLYERMTCGSKWDRDIAMRAIPV